MIWGKTTIARMPPPRTRKSGSEARTMVSIRMSEIWAAANRHTPTGGVIRPSARAMTVTDDEVYGINADANDRRQKNRDQDEDRGDGVHEHADGDQECKNQDEHAVGSERQRPEKFGDLYGQSIESEYPCRELSGNGDEQNGPGYAGHVEKHLRNVTPADLAVNENRQQEGVDYGDSGGLGRSEEAADDAPQQEGRGQQRRYGLHAGTPKGVPAKRGRSSHTVAYRIEVVVGHEQEADEYPRHQPGGQ